MSDAATVVSLFTLTFVPRQDGGIKISVRSYFLPLKQCRGNLAYQQDLSLVFNPDVAIWRNVRPLQNFIWFTLLKKKNPKRTIRNSKIQEQIFQNSHLGLWKNFGKNAFNFFELFFYCFSFPPLQNNLLACHHICRKEKGGGEEW